MTIGLPQLSPAAKTIVKVHLKDIEGDFQILEKIIHEPTQNEHKCISMTFDEEEQCVCFIGFGNDFNAIKAGDKLLGANGTCVVKSVYFIIRGDESLAPSKAMRELMAEVRSSQDSTITVG